MIRKLLALGTAIVTIAIAGVLAFGYSATAHDAQFRAKLRNPSGRVVGTVEFRIRHEAMYVDARLRPNRYITPDQFHGFHIHANNVATNGEGCQADPDAASSSWFVSADGHLSAEGQTHGAHNGDLPSPLVLADGTARLAFTTDRIEPSLLRGRAVILHDKPDNFGNVPPDQYSPTNAGAISLTERTGNAGDRVACGLVRRSR